MSTVRPHAPSNLRAAPAELTPARVERLLALGDVLERTAPPADRTPMAAASEERR